MTRNPDATVYVYRHRETGAITALYSDAALDMPYQADYEHVATLEPRMWIEHHFDDAIKEREACAKLCDESAIRLFSGKSRVNQVDRHTAEVLRRHAEAIRARGNK